MIFCFFDSPHPAADREWEDGGNLPTSLLSCVHLERTQCNPEAWTNGTQGLREK